MRKNRGRLSSDEMTSVVVSALEKELNNQGNDDR